MVNKNVCHNCNKQFVHPSELPEHKQEYHSGKIVKVVEDPLSKSATDRLR